MLYPIQKGRLKKWEDEIIDFFLILSDGLCSYLNSAQPFPMLV